MGSSWSVQPSSSHFPFRFSSSLLHLCWNCTAALCFLQKKKFFFLFKMPVQRFECIDIPLDKSMSAEQAYGESGFGHFDDVVTIRPPSVLYHTRPNPLVPLCTQKRTAVEAFVAGELGRCAVPRAKPVVAGSTEPVYTVVAGGAAIEVADSDDGVDGDGSMSTAGKSGNDSTDNDLDYQQPNDEMVDNGAGGQVPDNGGSDPQPAKQNKTVGFNSLLSPLAYYCRIASWKPLRQTLRPSGGLRKPLLPFGRLSRQSKTCPVPHHTLVYAFAASKQDRVLCVIWNMNTIPASIAQNSTLCAIRYDIPSGSGPHL